MTRDTRRLYPECEVIGATIAAKADDWHVQQTESEADRLLRLFLGIDGPRRRVVRARFIDPPARREPPPRRDPDAVRRMDGALGPAASTPVRAADAAPVVGREASPISNLRASSRHKPWTGREFPPASIISSLWLMRGRRWAGYPLTSLTRARRCDLGFSSSLGSRRRSKSFSVIVCAENGGNFAPMSAGGGGGL
jgi:hypothetical protein